MADDGTPVPTPSPAPVPRVSSPPDWPHRVRVLSHLWVPMTDGVRLAAKVWLPVARGAGTRDGDLDCGAPAAPGPVTRAPAAEDPAHGTIPAPAILEFLPYRKSDYTVRRDQRYHWMAGVGGYAGVRVDIRGSGDSEGFYDDEYEAQEQADCCEVIAWIAAQPWCSGQVGMYGKSWGGFNGLQVAYCRPPALKAVISLYSTDDRYADDVHYMGGCVLGSEALSWASIMWAWNSRPPCEHNVGADWAKVWLERARRTTPWLHRWLSHQARDGFWRHASVCTDYSRVACPVYMIGGWADGYTNAVFRTIARLPGSKALVGPWAHEWPDIACPGPQIGFLQECKRWWDRHLRGIDNGIDAEPQVRLWARTRVPPTPLLLHCPGRWIAAPAWPPVPTPAAPDSAHSTAASPAPMDGAAAVSCLALVMTPAGRLSPLEQPSDGGTREAAIGDIDAAVWGLFGADGDHADNAAVDGGPVAAAAETGGWVARLASTKGNAAGQCGGEWLAYGGAELACDQRADDGWSTVWDTAPLDTDTTIVGFPVVRCTVSADQPAAQVIARLCEVQPDGTSCLVTRGMLNLTHRHGHGPDRLAPVVPGQHMAVTVRLNAIAHTVSAGNRVRLAVSAAYWPMAWPSPKPVTVSIYCDDALTTNGSPASGTEVAGGSEAGAPAWLLGHASVLRLPVRDCSHAAAVALDATLPEFEAPVGPPPLRKTPLRPGSYSRELKTALSGSKLVSTVTTDSGATVWHGVGVRSTAGGGADVAVDMAYEEVDTEVYSLDPRDPTSASVTIEHTVRMAYDGPTRRCGAAPASDAAGAGGAGAGAGAGRGPGAAAASGGGDGSKAGKVPVKGEPAGADGRRLDAVARERMDRLPPPSFSPSSTAGTAVDEAAHASGASGVRSEASVRLHLDVDRSSDEAPGTFTASVAAADGSGGGGAATADGGSRAAVGGGHGEWDTTVHTRSEMRCDESSFFLTDRVVAWQGDRLAFDVAHRATIPRNLV